MLGPLRTGCDEAEAERRARELLTRFRLIQYAQQNPYTLSGGEKRRLTVASALPRRRACSSSTSRPSARTGAPGCRSCA